MRSIIGGVFVFGCLGCVPQRDLSSYSESEGPVQSAAVDRAPDERQADPEGSPAAATPAVADGTAAVPAGPAAVEGEGLADAALDRTSTNSTASEPAASEPAMPSDVSPTAPPAADAADSCAAMGGFTIAATSSCYMLGDNVFAWQDARSFCQAWGGDLVEIGSFEENEALAQRLEESAWIGANDQEEEGTFRWVGGEPLGYAGWSFNQPNNLQGNEDCSELRPTDERWSDVPCTGNVPRRALCERP